MELERKQQMKLQTAVGGTLREIRQRKNLTLRQLSDRAYISYNFLSEIETGKKCASNDMLETIAKGLDVTTAQLIKEIYEYLGGKNNE
jgi:transcriptional regulator with XRE-family HTH domain